MKTQTDATQRHDGCGASGGEISERLAELRETARDDFIEQVRATRAFGEDERKAYFIRGTAPRQPGDPFRAGEFADRKMERAFIGYCLGRAQAETAAEIAAEALN